MRALSYSLLAISLLFSIVYGQERIDVIYLKNGDIRKGIITENVPNNYVKIEMSEGSTFTIKYADIEKIMKEAKPVAATKQYQATSEAPNGLMSRKLDVGITAAVWFSGTVDYKLVYVAYDPEKATGFLLHAFLDGYVVDKLGVGIYMNFSPMTWNNYTQTTTMLEEGVSIKARFPISDGSATIKPGISIGHRGFSSDYAMSDKVHALAVGLSCEVQFYIRSMCVPYVEIGALGQPSGSNDYDPAITFPPIFYFGGGVAF